MLRRSRLPLLAEISEPAPGRAWALRRGDFDNLREALPRLTGQRVLAIVGEGEAPAVAAIGLAAAASAGGHSTILVECDLAQPRLAGSVGLAAAPGLHEYLRWEAEPRDVLQPVSLAGAAAGNGTAQLVCFTAGRPAQKTETLLGLQSFAHMVGKLRGAYELVLLLAPPVLSEPAACLAVAGQADAVVASEVKGGDPAVRKAIRGLPPTVLGAISVAG